MSHAINSRPRRGAATGAHRLTLPLYVTLAALSAMGPLVTDLYLPGLPDMAHALDTTPGLAQMTMSVNLIGLALGQLYIGILSDRIGRRRPLLISLVLFIGTSVLCAIAVDIWMLLVVRLLQGLVGAGVLVIGRAVVRDLFAPAVAARIYSQLMAVFLIAPVVAPVIGGQILRFSSWRGVFWALTLIGVLLLVLSYVVMKESLPAERRHGGEGQVRQMGRLLLQPVFAAHTLIGGLQGTVLFAYISMSSFFLRDAYGVSPQGYSLIFALNALGMVAGSITNTRLVRRGPARIMRLTVCLNLAACALLCAVVVADAPLWLVVGSLVVVLLTLSPGMPNNLALAMAPMAKSAGAAAALLGAANFLMGAAIPALVSQVSTSGVAMAATMTAASLLVTVLALGVTRHVLHADEPAVRTA